MAVAWPALAVASFSWTSPLPFPSLLSMTDVKQGSGLWGCICRGIVPDRA